MNSSTPAFATPLPLSTRTRAPVHRRGICASAASTTQPQAPLLLRAARGERVARPPVWLMRQAGRYMAEFRVYSDNYPFRTRSETPDIAFELSMQPYRAFKTDGVIMFSDILTPLPAIGIDFDILPGKGPRISNPVRTMADMEALRAASFEPETHLPFVAELLERLRRELEREDTTLLGFVGAPFTLAAYAIESAAAKNLVVTKGYMYGADAFPEEVLTGTLDKLAEVVGKYMVFQIDHGAQVVQVFDSWAHHLSPDQYMRYALPYARKAVEIAKRERPDTPVIFFANGSAGKLEDIQRVLGDIVDVISLDWSVSMAGARQRLGDDVVLQGNVDPSVLLTGSDGAIREMVRETVRQAGDGGLILNLGHGVIKETREDAVKVFCEAARELAPSMV